MQTAAERFFISIFATSFIMKGLLAANVTCKSEYNLLEELFDSKRYNNRVRPVTNSQDAVTVTFGLVVKEIEDLDDKNQLLITRAEIREYWLDPLLEWNPSEYGGVKRISVDPGKIWLPDIVLYNNAGEGFGSGITRTKAVITHRGQVTLNVPTIIQSSCKLHVENYPFDQQNCKLKFGSWTYDSKGISLSLESSSADLSEYSESAAWELLGVPGEFHSKRYNCCPNPYHDVTYSVRIKRRALYYAMYLIIPCALIAVLTLLVFLLPPDCNERMTVGMAILVGLSFFFLLVAEYMPETSEAVPLIGMYYTVTMIQVSCAFFMTCCVLRFHHHNPTEGEVPEWAKKYLLGYGARLFCFKFGTSSDVNETTVQNGKVKNDLPSEENTNSSKSDKKTSNRILGDNIRHQMILEKRQEEWRKAALVLNHICIWVFLIAVVVSFLAIFLQAPL